jgi:4-hydroxy-2-oxoheptanedioate aldolase
MGSGSNLRARIAAGDELVAVRGDIGWSKEQLAQACGGGKGDFIWLDSQHSPYSDQLLVSFTGAAEQLGIPVQLRIPHTREAHKAGRFFDLGVSGVLVPEVMDPSTVQDAIDFTYYVPTGRRSWGGANRLGVRAKTAPTARRDYAAWWNASVLLSIQIESVEAVDNITSLARPGITHVTWGPNDLEFSLERHPEHSLKTVEACMQRVAEQLDGSGIRIAMGTATTPPERQKYRELGVTIFMTMP